MFSHWCCCWYAGGAAADASFFSNIQQDSDHGNGSGSGGSGGGSGGSGSSGGGGSPVAAAEVAVAAMDDRDRWRWCLMAVAALDGGHTTTSWCSMRAAQQEDKRVALGNATTSSCSTMPPLQYVALSSVVPQRHYPASLSATPW
jgi:hypothetical protein